MRVRKRPRLALEMGHLGCVDPFELALKEHPPGSGKLRLCAKGSSAKPLDLQRASLCIAGCGQALMDLSMRWFLESQGERSDDGPPSLGEMRMVVRRREAKLLGSLLRRHLGRLPQPPAWMRELLAAIEEMDEFLRWHAD